MTARADARSEASNDILIERRSQDLEFGDQIHDPAYWYAIMGKQFGQLGSRIVQAKWSKAFTRDRAEREMYHEATQVAACALALMEAIILGQLPNEITTAVPRDARQRARALGLGDESIRYDKTVEAEVQDTELPATVPAHLTSEQHKTIRKLTDVELPGNE